MPKPKQKSLMELAHDLQISYDNYIIARQDLVSFGTSVINSYVRRSYGR